MLKLVEFGIIKMSGRGNIYASISGNCADRMIGVVQVNFSNSRFLCNIQAVSHRVIRNTIRRIKTCI